jgi:phosphonate transport system substrate-binding protein
MSTWGFGVARMDAAASTRSVLGEICVCAGTAVGERFAPHVAASYRELAQALQSGAIGVAWMPPIPAIEVEENKIGTVLAVPARKGMASYHSAFVARKGGPTTLRECERGRAAWVDGESASGYVVPRLHLASLGFDVAHFFSEEIFARTHVAVVDAVVAGRADVGATFCSFDGNGKRILNAGWTESDGSGARAVKMIASAGPIPNDAIVGSAKLPLHLRGSLTRWLLHLSAREQELFHRLLRSAEFRVFAPAHFDPLKHMIRAARSRGL